MDIVKLTSHLGRPPCGVSVSTFSGNGRSAVCHFHPKLQLDPRDDFTCLCFLMPFSHQPRSPLNLNYGVIMESGKEEKVISCAR
ncbi:hypothetical protein EMCRGX_G000006 [Ephydatia muelleri]